ncbi:MAG: hypothetical protein COV34_01310 [Candidatus Zambryskibacteria bacterium CG10_big_fil_rev_8_21_14_0_10_42_12]|uniref:Uncharacterized protein n=1 Tax=Candidatus Zambryskibacteria bacterium CG10_big_fil_rev_8_21_14_0_10_42_12 TaxID=1975115 RepID=A0A2H0QX90_9BACT|nr:MAG: hypothetical protein COV34_01310 [Candidatus Zambryskibacteria bacterium CG10_big_fil_rev_8_21_14_0_10_42_12]
MFARIKESSERTKNIFVWIFSGGVTLTIFALWAIFALPGILGTSDESAQKAAASPSVFGVLRDQISSLPANAINALERWGTEVNSSDLLDSKLEYKAES